MFKFFEKLSKANDVSYLKESIYAKPVTVAEIHQSFKTASELVLTETQNILNIPDKVSKENGEELKKLAALGFIKSVECKDYLALQEKKEAAAKHKEIAEYFAFWYPQNKYITHDKLMQICKKYGLVLGSTDRYIADIPEKNRKEIINFKARPEDTYLEYTGFYSVLGRVSFLSNDTLQNIATLNEDDRKAFETGGIINGGRYKEARLQIVAVPKMFDTTDMEIQNNQLVHRLPDDPIVLHQVNRGGIHGYLIVSMWGEEAKASELQNPSQN